MKKIKNIINYYIKKFEKLILKNGNTYVCMYVCIYMYVCVCVCVCVCMYVGMYVHYIHIYMKS